jgi:murein L,D-transpeptidase YafK
MIKNITLLTNTVRHLFICIACSALTSKAADYYPKVLLQMDPKYTHHVLLVEKSTHKLYLYGQKDGTPILMNEYQMATGKNTGDKSVEGDNKTPEGIYQLYQFHSASDLLKQYGSYGKIYGSGAFVLNYPNVLDRRAGKTGGGIWLHSTDDESRISKGLDSKGCVVVGNNDLKEISRYIDLETKTTIVVTDSIEFWSDATWKKAKDKLASTVDAWVTSWKMQKLDQYLSFYDKSDFKDEQGKNYKAWADHKERVFKSTKDLDVKALQVSLFRHGPYALVSFEQYYNSNLIKDSGRKYLVFKEDKEYNWKIVYEGWESIKQVSDIAFTPNLRFIR